MIYDGSVATVVYAYDTRDRGTAVNLGPKSLAAYAWLGGALHSRSVVCDYPDVGEHAPPIFKTELQRDGLLRVTKALTEHQTADQSDAGFRDLGTWEYGYDAAANALSAAQAGSPGWLEASQWYEYDTLNRLTDARVKDSQNLSDPLESTTTYEYDDLGNRQSHSYRGAAAIGYQHDKANRMTMLADKTQRYDQAGNVTVAYSADRSVSYKYAYDHHNRLTWVGRITGGTEPNYTTTRKATFAWDALGRRIEHINDETGTTRRYFYDGVNEAVEYDQAGVRQNYYVHGLSYIDERVMMMHVDTVGEQQVDRPYYYVPDRVYNVRLLVDRGGAIVERYAYDPYGRPLIRESAGRGDMDDDGDIDGTDATRFAAVLAGSKWDPRADLDDDGDVDDADDAAFTTKRGAWDPALDPSTIAAQAFSDKDNPYMFQGVPHFALDTAASATAGVLMLN